MARCEGSPRYRAPGIDLLECRLLLSPLRGNAEVSRTSSMVAAEISHQAVATADTDPSEDSRIAANSLHNLSPVDEDVSDVIATLKSDLETIFAKSQVTVAELSKVEGDLQKILSESTSQPDQTKLQTLIKDVQAQAGQLPTAAQKSQLESDFTAVLGSQGITDQSLITTTITDIESVVSSLDIDEADATPGATSAVVGPGQTDPNLLFSESPRHADDAIEEPTSGLETSLVISSETTHLALMVNPGPPIAAGVESYFDRGMIVAPSDPQRILPGITTESLERLDALMSVDPGLGAEAKVEAAPRRSDLLSDFLPFDRRSLEDAFDRFFDRLEDLGDGAPAPYDPACTIPDSLIVAAAIGALELGRRYWRRRRESGEAGRDETIEGEDDGGNSGRPGHWSARFT